MTYDQWQQIELAKRAVYIACRKRGGLAILVIAVFVAIAGLTFVGFTDSLTRAMVYSTLIIGSLPFFGDLHRWHMAHIEWYSHVLDGPEDSGEVDCPDERSRR